MFKHPIVNLYFFLSVSIALVFSNSISSLILFSALLALIFVINNQFALKAIKKFLATIFFLPFMLIFYIAISLFFTQMTFFESMHNAFFAFSKLSIIMLLMNIYMEMSSAEKLIISFRSLWLNTALKWRWVDDLFLFLSLALRLYPTFRSNWTNNRASLKAIGIKFNKSYFGKLFDISRELPAMLVYQLNRSNDIALAMKLRGYGLQYPRNVINPIYFSFFNLVQIALITFLMSCLIEFI